MLLEVQDGFRRALVVEKAEVLLFEAGDEFSVLVGDSKDEIDFVNLDFDGLGGLIGIVNRQLAGLLRGGL